MIGHFQFQVIVLVKIVKRVENSQTKHFTKLVELFHQRTNLAVLTRRHSNIAPKISIANVFEQIKHTEYKYFISRYRIPQKTKYFVRRNKIIILAIIYYIKTTHENQGSFYIKNCPSVLLIPRPLNGALNINLRVQYTIRPYKSVFVRIIYYLLINYNRFVLFLTIVLQLSTINTLEFQMKQLFYCNYQKCF